MITPKKMPERGPLRRYAREHNKLVDYARSIQIVPGRNVRLVRSPRGTIVQAQKGGTQGKGTKSDIGLFEVTSIGDTYLNCSYAGNYPDSFPTGNVVVQKPTYLWPPSVAAHQYYDVTYINDATVANYNGRRGSATLDGHTLIWYERLMPPYVTDGDTFAPGDIKYIHAAKVTGELATVYGEWIDLNLDGRTWQQRPRAYAVCVSGSPQYVALFGGPPSIT